ncbi:MAG: hypothetical protein J5I93_13805 [Pirellulaceae bacterium]|nr:hypothetical protein [Pirellulaceae bacterium]
MPKPDTGSVRVTSIRRAAVAYLALQGLGGLAWWSMLLGWPASRTWFMAGGAPESTLWAFAPADLLLFAGGSLLAAYGLSQQRRWAWGVLCLHAGAAGYAALYCLALGWLEPSAWLGALLMCPSLVVPLLLAWLLRPWRVEP